MIRFPDTCKIVAVVFSFTLLFSVSAQQDVSISGGKFMMGDKGGESDEDPEHEVTLSGFRMDRFEVTEKQYDSCVQEGKCTPAHYEDGKCLAWNGKSFVKVTVSSAYRNPDYPVVCVTWYQARAYCRFRGKDLPSEARWEYSARAGGKSVYAWGDTEPGEKLCANAQKRHPLQVGSFTQNNWGLYDMTGNVWEWTKDFYERDYYKLSETRDPHGPDAGLYRVIRGGGWYSGAAQMRISNRHWFSPAYPEVSIGFRCSR